MDEKRLLELSMQTLNREDYSSMGDTESGGTRMEELGDENRAGIHERMLIELVIDGHVENVENHLQTYPETNVNAVDYQGRTALQMAVRNQNDEVIDFLITLPALRMGDTLLYAVREGKPDIVEKLLQWQSRMEDIGILEGPFESAEFLPHMTPLMLACHENNYEVVQLLLHHDYTIRVPAPDSYKDDPKASKVGETLELGIARVDSYMALASPIYMALTSSDPILAAFVLSNESDRLQYTDPIYKAEYEAISERCREFATDLLDECRSSEEVWILLTRNHDPEALGVPTDNEYSRLTLALEFEQKSFVTHKNCQQVLQNLWTQHHPDVMWMSTFSLLTYFLPRLMLMPFVYMAMYLVPCAGIFTVWEAPMNKFLGDLVSFLLFILLVVFSILSGSDHADERIPGLNGGIDIIVWIYVVGYTWENIYILVEKGPTAYQRDWWLIYRALMNMCFLGAFLARLSSYIMSKQHGTDYENEARIFWPWYDPMLFSECFYAVGAILAIVRILYMFQVSQVLGPLQLSLAPMFANVFQMLVILAVIIFAFGTGFFKLYGSYTEMIRIDADEDKEQSEAFETWPTSLVSLFWIVFGFGDVSDAEVIVSNTCANSTETVCYDANYHVLTQFVGQILYASYHLIMATTLLNMLIAMMSNSLQDIQDNADQEWKFARSKVWMTYYERKRVLPIPWNILPSPWHFINVIRWIVSKCSGEKPDVSWSFERCCDVDIKTIDAERMAMWDQKYKALMKRLIQRYLSQLVREATKDEMVTPENLEQMKIDIVKEMQRIQNPEKHDKKLISLTSMATKKKKRSRDTESVDSLDNLRGWSLYKERQRQKDGAPAVAPITEEKGDKY